MMIELRKLNDLKLYVSEARNKGLSIGFVPTMGFLHDGHMSLIKLSNINSDLTIASIYVNPSQFNDLEDFKNYPKDEGRDIELLQNNNCDAVFIPDQYEIESLSKVVIDLKGLDELMEGKFRPGHFNGLVDVVYRLFCAVTPDNAFFGEKDYQQLQIIQKLVDELKMPINIIGGPILREPSGLAMSSRNSRLSAAHRVSAGFIYEVLRNFKPQDRNLAEEMLADSGFELEYLESFTFGESKRLFVAGILDGVRLIDNVNIS